MSYNSINACANDLGFQGRATAAYAQEGATDPNAAYWQHRWALAADPSIEPPYESALAAGTPDPGIDEAVITDAMLLAAVQATGMP